MKLYRGTLFLIKRPSLCTIVLETLENSKKKLAKRNVFFRSYFPETVIWNEKSPRVKQDFFHENIRKEYSCAE